MSMRNHKITCETCRWFNPHENTSTGICNFPKEEPASVEVCWLSKNNNACQQYAPVLSFADLEQTQPKDYTQDKDYLASRKKLQEDINSLKCLGNLLK